MTSDVRTVVCVTGGPRSGTSLAMRALSLLGVSLGPDAALKPPGPANPAGFWEHEGINRLNESILRTLGGSRREPPAPAPGWEASERLEPERAAAQTLLAEDFAGRETWGWKDTSNSLTLPFWQHLLGREVRYVVCIRNPLDVAASLERHGGFAKEEVFALWPAYARATLTHTAGRPRLVVPYEEWFDDWWSLVLRLAGFIGRQPPAPGSATARRIEQFVDSDLRHHRAGNLEAPDGVPPEVAALYRALSELDDAAAAR